jgi:hypothetical protein
MKDFKNYKRSKKLRAQTYKKEGNMNYALNNLDHRNDSRIHLCLQETETKRAWIR